MEKLEHIKNQLKVNLKKHQIDFRSISIYEEELVIFSNNSEEKEIAYLEKVSKSLLKIVCKDSEIPNITAEFREQGNTEDSKYYVKTNMTKNVRCRDDGYAEVHESADPRIR